ncbi:MAG: 1-deoxy-D-xylulose-5-phosphate synthase [Myxococcaceae bacterium]|nr:1-deoxy-D-xylulose-5-phosphate synthase [Myxococcaceae bacterium]
MSSFALLESIDSPAALRALPRASLAQLAAELRDYVLLSVSKTGGHLASNLGSIELTVALHYVFDTPHDRLVWDVGHQTYAHKILTGRREHMRTLRKLGGISGFPRRSESEYDSFGTAHSSTSISAALGMVHAARLAGQPRRAVAIIGDGAMSAGMAFEALNNAGAPHMGRASDLLVVLNDNAMSISPPTGALSHYLVELAERTRQVPEQLFESLGFHYTGPVDGHDLDALLDALSTLRSAQGPQFLHVLTKKGYGYKLAEADPIGYHGLGGFDPAEGLHVPRKATKQTFTQVFGRWLCDTAALDPKLVAITPAMREGSGLVEFHERFPERYFDVGIAEQHAVTFAAGLAAEGFKPVVAIYSTFLQRAYDQLIHDVAVQNLPVLFALDRAGVVGADGATHMGAFDLAYLRCIPNMAVLTPADELETRALLCTGYKRDHPVAVRYPRGSGSGVAVPSELRELPWGKAEQRRAGKRIALLAFGTLLYPALAAAERLDASVINMRFVKPLDRALLFELADCHEAFVTLEEGSLQGGAGSAVAETLLSAGLSIPVLMLGLPDAFVEHGEPAQLLSTLGLDAAGIEAAIRERFADFLME